MIDNYGRYSAGSRRRRVIETSLERVLQSAATAAGTWAIAHQAHILTERFWHGVEIAAIGGALDAVLTLCRVSGHRASARLQGRPYR